MNAITRVVRAPWLVVLVAGGQLLVAAFLGSGVGAAIAASLGQFSIAVERTLLGAVLELFQSHPALAQEIPRVVTGSALFAVVFWTLLSPVIILRLRARRSVTRLAADAVRALPAVIVTTFWNLIPRVVLVALTGILAALLMHKGSWGLVGLAMVVLTLAYSTCALDLARCRVVLSGARGFHPRTALRSYRAAWRRPTILAASILASLGQWFFLGSSLAVGANASSGVWSVRGLALAALVCALVRISIAVGANSKQSLS